MKNWYFWLTMPLYYFAFKHYIRIKMNLFLLVLDDKLFLLSIYLYKYIDLNFSEL